MLRRGIVEHAWCRNVGCHGTKEHNGPATQAARRITVTAAVNMHELVLSGHSGAHGTDKVDCSLDVDVDCLVERVEL